MIKEQEKKLSLYSENYPAHSKKYPIQSIVFFCIISFCIFTKKNGGQMFLISDSLEEREKIIYELNLVNPTAAFTLAFAHFRWTVNRLILSLSRTTTTVLKERLECVKDAQTLKSLWRKEIGETLKAPSISNIIKNWDDIKFSYLFNEKLLINASPELGSEINLVVPNIMEATYDLCTFSKAYDLHLYKKVTTKYSKFMKVV